MEAKELQDRMAALDDRIICHKSTTEEPQFTFVYKQERMNLTRRCANVWDIQGYHSENDQDLLYGYLTSVLEDEWISKWRNVIHVPHCFKKQFQALLGEEHSSFYFGNENELTIIWKTKELLDRYRTQSNRSSELRHTFKLTIQPTHTDVETCFDYGSFLAEDHEATTFKLRTISDYMTFQKEVTDRLRLIAHVINQCEKGFVGRTLMDTAKERIKVQENWFRGDSVYVGIESVGSFGLSNTTIVDEVEIKENDKGKTDKEIKRAQKLYRQYDRHKRFEKRMYEN